MNKEYIKIGTNYIVSDEEGNLKVLESESRKALEQKLYQENKVENLESSSKVLKRKLIEGKKKIKREEKNLKKGRIKFIASCILVVSIITFLSLITNITYTYFLTLLLPFSVAGLYCLVEAAINFIEKYKSKIKEYKKDIKEDEKNLDILLEKLNKAQEKLNLLDYNNDIKYIQNVDISNMIVEPKLSIEETSLKEKESIKKLELK
jgi:uncharacterized membrane protein (DUF106 family)